MTISVMRLNVAEQDTRKRYSPVEHHNCYKTQGRIDNIRHFPPYVKIFKGGSSGLVNVLVNVLVGWW